MKTRKTKILASTAAGAAIVAGALFAAAPANAISRATCGQDYLQLFSQATTCWANAGTTTVALFGVVGYSSGNNAGSLKSDTGKPWTFNKRVSSGLGTGSYTINIITINK